MSFISGETMTGPHNLSLYYGEKQVEKVIWSSTPVVSNDVKKAYYGDEVKKNVHLLKWNIYLLGIKY